MFYTVWYSKEHHTEQDKNILGFTTDDNAENLEKFKNNALLENC